MSERNLLDKTGRRRSPAVTPGYRAGYLARPVELCVARRTSSRQASALLVGQTISDRRQPRRPVLGRRRPYARNSNARTLVAAIQRGGCCGQLGRRSATRIHEAQTLPRVRLDGRDGSEAASASSNAPTYFKPDFDM
jgi:hypothetical protein